MLNTVLTSGDPVVAETLQRIFNSFIKAGVMEGFDFYVQNNNTLGITAGSSFSDSGVFIFENEEKFLTIEQTVSAKDYTVIYSYLNSSTFGGSPTQLQLVQGLLNEDTFSGGVILGWVKYAGGSLPLSQSMLFPAAKIRLERPANTRKNNFESVMAPLDAKIVQKQLNPNISIHSSFNGSEKSIVTEFVNTSSLLETTEILVPFEVPIEGAGQVLVECSVSTMANMSVFVQNDDGALKKLSTYPIINKPMKKEIYTIPKDIALEYGKVFYVILKLTMQPLESIKIKRVGISRYMEPV